MRFSAILSFNWSPTEYEFLRPIDTDVRFWVYFLIQGKFYAMFALLFGVGFYIFMERLEKRNLGLNNSSANHHHGNLLNNGILFSSLIMMILGIILYRKGIFRNYHALPWYWVISIILLAAALVMNYRYYHDNTYSYFKPNQHILKDMILSFRKEMLALSYVLLFNGIYQKFFRKWKFSPLSNVGRMALSNYIFQSILCGFIFYGFGLDYFNKFSRSDLLYLVTIIWIMQLILSQLWLSKYK